MPDSKVELLAFEFSALHRLYAVFDAQHGERMWQWKQDFDALSDALKSPGHWYRFENGNGVIHVDEQGNGQFCRNLPPEIGFSLVLDVPPAVKATSLLNYMRSIIAKLPPSPKVVELSNFVTRLAGLAEKKEAGKAVNRFAIHGLLRDWPAWSFI